MRRDIYGIVGSKCCINGDAFFFFRAAFSARVHVKILKLYLFHDAFMDSARAACIICGSRIGTKYTGISGRLPHKLKKEEKTLLREKLKEDSFIKELVPKMLFACLVAILGLLLLNVLSEDRDGRKQIIDEDGGSEYASGFFENAAEDATEEERRLSSILGSVDGVGLVHVMVGENGVIVAAEGASDAIVKNEIINAVSALYGIPAGNVKVFEKERERVK